MSDSKSFIHTCYYFVENRPKIDVCLSTLPTKSWVTCLRFCACHKIIEAVVRHGCIEIGLNPSQCIEGAFRAGFFWWHNQNNHDQGPDLWCEGQDHFVSFEEINDIMQWISHFTFPQTVTGLCQ